MSQSRTTGGASMRDGEEGDNCGEAVMAAMKAIGKHCNTEGVPIQTATNHVVMVPKEDAEKVRNYAPQEMSEREMMREAEDSPWLDEWASGMCEKAGLEEGSDAWETCYLNHVRDVLDA